MPVYPTRLRPQRDSDLHFAYEKLMYLEEEDDKRLEYMLILKKVLISANKKGDLIKLRHKIA